jgi:hypothetical protein
MLEISDLSEGNGPYEYLYVLMCRTIYIVI